MGVRSTPSGGGTLRSTRRRRFVIVAKWLASEHLDLSGGVVPFKERSPSSECKRTKHVAVRRIVRRLRFSE
jgi:hypothetical protein